MMKRKFRKIEFDIFLALGVVMMLIVIGMTFYHFNEHLIWSDAFYFATTTIMTIGFGDFAPTTHAAKIFTAIYALIGVPTMVFAMGMVVEDYLEDRMDRIETRLNERINK